MAKENNSDGKVGDASWLIGAAANIIAEKPQFRDPEMIDLLNKQLGPNWMQIVETEMKQQVELSRSSRNKKKQP